ncbi:MAG: cytochrome c biogenesis heme-transporting ATPase CcmA [Burkholderiales bacterium]|nr:cytochrome c biogenesis heme-transporting ATPase CcmA [Burkholderiales bacterium]
MLEAHDLAARRGSLLLFEGLPIRVPAGQALVVRGRNGSGKTTLLRILAGLSLPAAGRVTWNGRDVARHDASLRADVCFAGHLPALKDELTASENLHALVALAGGHTDRPALRRALVEVGLDTRRNLPARALSQGQRRRIALARLSVGRQRLWLLDEPATALDADGLTLLAALVARHLAQGGTLVAATHQPLALPADRVRVLELG